MHSAEFSPSFSRIGRIGTIGKAGARPAIRFVGKVLPPFFAREIPRQRGAGIGEEIRRVRSNLTGEVADNIARPIAIAADEQSRAVL